MFYLFDFAKVVIFLPFTKYFCNYFCFRHYFFYLDYIGARLHLCAIVERLEQGSTPPPTASPAFRHPQQPPTHEQQRTRPTHPRPLQGERWARPRPVWMLHVLSRAPLMPSRTPSPAWGGCVLIYLSFALPSQNQRVAARRPLYREVEPFKIIPLL